MTVFNVTIGFKTHYWTQEALKKKLRNLNGSLLAEYVNRKLDIKSTIPYECIPFVHKDSKEGVMTLLQLRRQIRYVNDSNLTELFNQAIRSVNRWDKIIGVPKGFTSPTESLLLIKIGGRSPFLAEQCVCKRFGKVFEQPRMKRKPSPVYSMGMDLDFSFPEISDEVSKWIECQLRNDRGDAEFNNAGQLIELLDCVQRFKMDDNAFTKFVLPVFCNRGTENKSIQFKAHEKKLALIVLHDEQVPNFTKFHPYAHHFSRLDLRGMQKIPSWVKGFSSSEIIVHPYQDLSALAKKKFSKIICDLSRVESPEQFKMKMTEANLNALTHNGTRKIDLAGHESFTTANFIQILLSLPKNTVRSLNFSSHDSLSHDQLQTVLAHHSQVRSLNLSDCNFIHHSDSELPYGYIAKMTTHLLTLNMDGLSKGSLNDIAFILRNSPKLEGASFCDWGSIDVERGVHEAKSENRLHKSVLRLLKLDGCSLREEHRHEQVKILADLLPVSLEVLNLDKTNFAQGFIEPLVDKKISLKKISLRDCEGLKGNSEKILRKGIASLESLNMG